MLNRLVRIAICASAAVCLWAMPDGFYVDFGFHSVGDWWSVTNDTNTSYYYTNSSSSSAVGSNGITNSSVGTTVGVGYAVHLEDNFFAEISTRIPLFYPQNDIGKFIATPIIEAAIGVGAGIDAPYLPLSVYAEYRLEPLLLLGQLMGGAVTPGVTNVIHPNIHSLVLGTEWLMARDWGIKLCYEFSLSPMFAAIMGLHSPFDWSLRVSGMLFL
ncbi:MAG: hypothetical protein HZC28_09080 [Spirochaetes bacterium]|nr:hypothetical protein [Spirochaetota bacterium]